MIVLVFIGFILLVAVALVLVARRVSAGVERRWQAWAAKLGARYSRNGTRSMIAFDHAGVAVQIAVFVGYANVLGRRRYFNSLRATGALSTGWAFHLLYMPDAHPEPMLVGDDSGVVRAWLASVDDVVKLRPGIAISSDGTALTVDLDRKRDSIEDFQILTTAITRLIDARASTVSRAASAVV